PLTEAQTKRNRYLSKTRYVVEQSFGMLHRKFRYARAAYFGLLKVSAQSHLKAMCLNLLKAANRLRPLQNSPKSPKFPSRHLGDFS
ncbi:transposase, partial [Neisseria mucosa]|uniref:transposase n=1 Tax=Neisseria mucosa TaxID=488 RepID=UPI00254FA9DB